VSAALQPVEQVVLQPEAVLLELELAPGQEQVSEPVLAPELGQAEV